MLMEWILCLIAAIAAPRGDAPSAEDRATRVVEERAEDRAYESAGPVQYGDHDSQVLYVNYFPEGPARAAMIYVNSGGWNSQPLNNQPPLPPMYENLGMAFVVVCHRSLHIAPHPAQVNDVEAGIRHVKEHAADWNIDPERLAVTGRSSGGHLAMLATYRPDAPKVAAVIERVGPSDFSPEFVATINPKIVHLNYFDILFGPKVKDRESEAFREAMREFSPATYMSPDDPPTLFMGNREGPPPPLEEMTPNWGVHNERFVERAYAQFKEAGGVAEIYIGELGGDRSEAERIEAEFLRKHLKLADDGDSEKENASEPKGAGQ